MSNENMKQLKPFLSVIFFILSMFVIVFFQMEERRLSYSLYKLNREYKNELEEKRKQSIQLAKLTRPQNVENIAQNKMDLKKVQKSQIIHLSGADVIKKSKEEM